jgi:hypothetical protein
MYRFALSPHVFTQPYAILDAVSAYVVAITLSRSIAEWRFLIRNERPTVHRSNPVRPWSVARGNHGVARMPSRQICGRYSFWRYRYQVADRGCLIRQLAAPHITALPPCMV